MRGRNTEEKNNNTGLFGSVEIIYIYTHTYIFNLYVNWTHSIKDITVKKLIHSIHWKYGMYRTKQ